MSTGGGFERGSSLRADAGYWARSHVSVETKETVVPVDLAEILSDGVTDNDDYSTVAGMVERFPASVRLVVFDVDGSYSASAKPHLDGFGLTGKIGTIRSDSIMWQIPSPRLWPPRPARIGRDSRLATRRLFFVSPPTLLIYPFGHNDLQAGGKPVTNSGEFLADRTALGVDLMDGEISLYDGEDKVASMPILQSVLAYVGAQVDDGEIDLLPILTRQQGELAGTNTAPLRTVLELACDAGGFSRLLDSWLVDGGPQDYAAVLSLYRESLFVRYRDIAGGYIHRFIQVTTATPAMTFATSVFARDPDLTMLYTSKGRDPMEMPVFRTDLTDDTDTLVEALAESLDWRAASLVVAQPDNGYTPVTVTIEHPRQAAIDAGRTLDDWWNRRWKRISRNNTKNVPGLLADHCATLHTASATIGHQDQLDWGLVWLTRSADVLMRALCHRYRGEAPLAVIALASFREAIGYWGIARINGDENPADDEEYRGDGLALGVAAFNRDFDPEWYRAYAVLDWVYDGAFVRLARNEMIHGGAGLPASYLERHLGELGCDCPMSTGAPHHPALDRLIELARRIMSLAGVSSYPALELSDGSFETGLLPALNSPEDQVTDDVDQWFQRHSLRID